MKKIIALLTALILTFSFATVCFAAESPTKEVLPTEEPTGEGEGETPGGSTSTTSPKTGLPLAGAFVAVITSTGLALVAKKEME